MNYHFRSAINGFNREDVVAYIEYISKQHTQQVNQLAGELDFEKKRAQNGNAEELAALRRELNELRTHCQAVEEENAAFTRHLEALEEERDTLAAQRDELNRKLSQPEKEEAPKQATSDNRELEIYRRAEQAERRAMERADRIRRKSTSALNQAAQVMDGTAGRIDSAIRQLNQQLNVLQQALDDSRDMLLQAAQDGRGEG